MRRFHRTIIGFVVGIVVLIMIILNLSFFVLQIIFAGDAGDQTLGLMWFGGALVSLVPQFVGLHFLQKYFVPWVDKPDKPQKRPGSRIERS